MSKDVFANPQAPANYNHPKNVSDSSTDMTNEDFRKLLMTPSVGGPKTASLGGGPTTTKVEFSHTKKKFNDESHQKRKEKKAHYASLMKEVKEREKELAEKYRDRAKERRELESSGAAPTVSTTSNFRAVAPDFSLSDNTDRRLKIIEESKYLGGDLEHTHLVKGLDYALLQKVKAELEKKDQELDEEQERENKANEEDDEDDEDKMDVKTSSKPKILTKSSNAAIAAALTKSLDDSSGLKRQIELAQKKAFAKPSKLDAKKPHEIEPEDESKIVFKTKLGRNVFRCLFESEPPKVNELFQPHRMAYIVDLTNEEELDIPITSIRSKADCPTDGTNTSMTTNDIVINKLTQILSYLRHGKRDTKKGKKKNMARSGEETVEASKTDVGLSIYDDIGDYVPNLAKKKESESGDRKSNRDYFDRKDRDEYRNDAPTAEAASEFIKNIVKSADKKSERDSKKEENVKKSTGMEVKFDADSYSECYPGTRAEDDVNIDSDEEADFSKMDLGKKGPVNRWDFESNEEYNNYMSNREALPKAAFQFGVKMGDGRKTRNKPGDSKADKNKLDKEWTKISQLIDKRKSGDMGILGSKKPKY